MQRHVLYLGEINSSQAAGWRKAIEVLDDDVGLPRTLALFPEDQSAAVASDASIVQLRLSDVRLCRPRQWGACWLAGQLWRDLRLDQFWAERLPPNRKELRAGMRSCRCWSRIRLIAPERRGSGRVTPQLVRQERYGRLVGGGRTSGLAEAHKPCACHDFSAAAQRRAILPSDGALAQPDFIWVQVMYTLYDLTSTCLPKINASERGGRRQALARLQPGQPAGLPAGGDRVGGHPGRSALGLRYWLATPKIAKPCADVPRQD